MRPTRIRDKKMLGKRNLVNKVDAVNQYYVMEVDAISKNGWSPKIQINCGTFLKKSFFSLLAVGIVICGLLFISCGGSAISGTYVGFDNGNELPEYSITFSGNKFKQVDREDVIKGTYEIVVDYKENDFSRGSITFIDRDGKETFNYSLEGNKLTFERWRTYIKK